MSNDFSLFGALETHRGRLEQTRENSGRLARAHGSWQSAGSGELIVPEPFMFGMTFVEEPSVSYGSSMPLVDEEPQELVAGSVPRCNGGVYRWVRDGNDFYTGCHAYFTVDFGYGGVPRTYTINHSLVITGMALKDLPRALVTLLAEEAF